MAVTICWLQIIKYSFLQLIFCNFFVCLLQKNMELTGKNMFKLAKVLIHMFGVFEILERIYNKNMRERY